ncbi:hypothetical protein Lal_00041071 [Lupinus albus]|nr:hypothetical protein Lal_00041071 [Lupinus albus]
MVGMRKDPKVGGGVGGTCEVAKNQTQHSPRKHGVSSGRFVWIQKGLVPKNAWTSLYIDNMYSRHMTGDKSQFLDLSLKENGYLTYGPKN